jgi:hypothetical protein
LEVGSLEFEIGKESLLRTWVISIAIVTGTAVALSAQAPTSMEAERVKARQKIFLMEGILERAVQLGVDNLRRKVRTVMPDDALVQGGPAQVRGFRLDGYGIFFDVEVPALRRSLAWTLRTMNETSRILARDLAQLRALMQSIDDPRVRAEFERTLQRVQQQMGPVPPAGAERVASAGRPTVAAQSVPAPRPVQAPEPSVDALLLVDPSEAYTQEVKAAIIDAMIENSGALLIGAEEWLTVAARDNAPSDPFMPGEEAPTIVLRIKGSDLLAFRAGRLTLQEMRGRVEVGKS